MSPVLQDLGYSLWGLECKGRGRSSIVRVFIDTDPPGGTVTISDVMRASRQVSMLFDLEDPIQGSYSLEVSSPGVERRLFTLEQCRGYLGEQIRVRLKVPREGRRTFAAELCDVELAGGTFTIDEDGTPHTFRFDEVREANLVWQD